MAWPDEFPAIEPSDRPLPTRRKRVVIPDADDVIWRPPVIEADAYRPHRRARRVAHPGLTYHDESPSWPRRYRQLHRGLHRIFNDAEFRLYRKQGSPPEEGDTPFDTNATLPHEPTDTHADGAWFFSVSYFNGVIDSGFLPIGPRGETWKRIDIDTGDEIGSPPAPALLVRLEQRPESVIRVHAVYAERGALRGQEFAISYTTDGSDPPEPPAEAPDITKAFTTRKVAHLLHDLPAAAHGVTVKVRVQIRRDDGGTWRYSEGSQVLSTIALDQLPTVPTSDPAARSWPGRLPEKF